MNKLTNITQFITKRTVHRDFQLCTKLGWRGKGTKYDLLPLVLSANGHDPDYFDIPRELVLEVQLVHPTYVLTIRLIIYFYNTNNNNNKKK